MVCDDAFLGAAKCVSSNVTPINLTHWLESDYSTKLSPDMLVCDTAHVIQRARQRDRSIYIVAVAGDLHSKQVSPMLDAGADDVITESDIVSGRLVLMLRQRHNQQSMSDRHVAISELTQSFYSAGNLRELIDSVCKSLLTTFNSKHATVCKLNHDGKFTLLAEWQRTETDIERANFASMKLMSNSICQWCVDNSQVGLIRRGAVDERDSTAAARIRKILGIGCSIALPLIHDDLVWGVLVLGKEASTRDFSDIELSLLEMLVAQMSNSILRQNLLDEIHFQAFHDSLTKLPNRLKFEKTLSQIVSSKNSTKEQFALLFLDLDGFKGVNDNQGHRIGDELLQHVSNRLVGCLQERDLLARIGGDEFAVLLRGVKSRESALSIATRLSKAVGKLFVIDKYRLKIGVSIGLCFYPDDGDTVDELLRNADFAMYEAKADGNSGVRSFNQSMAEQYRKRIALEQDLLCAVENDQFELYYQPKVDLVQGKVLGVEALLRWNHPDLGFVSPDEFVSVAEEAGFITSIGNWVLTQAISQSARWSNDGLPTLTMAVNISRPQFALEDFVDGVLGALERHSLDPTQLELEVQESVVMNNLSKVINKLNTLRDQGISIAIDDFGTGYSSLSCLELLPLDSIKIDKVFVDKMNLGNEECSLVNTILTMARTLGLKGVAEGIETHGQLQSLLALGCECVQGYYFAKPVPASKIPLVIEAIERELNSHNPAQLKAG